MLLTDKITFTVSVINTAVVPYVLGAAPVRWTPAPVPPPPRFPKHVPASFPVVAPGPFPHHPPTDLAPRLQMHPPASPLALDLAGVAPQAMFYILYSPKAILLTIVRYRDFVKTKKQWLLMDFCYWANGLVLFYIWIRPTDPVLFQVGAGDV